MTFVDYAILATLFVGCSTISLIGFKFALGIWEKCRPRQSSCLALNTPNSIVPQTCQNDRSELYNRIHWVLKDVAGCSKVSWDLWEMEKFVTPVMSLEEFRSEFRNDGLGFKLSAYNKRVQYCGTKDEFASTMMGLSFAHDIVEMQVIKSMGDKHGIICILFHLNGSGNTNIDADVIEELSSMTCAA